MLQQFVLGLIGLYQKISRFTPKVCRYYPSCSNYTRQAITLYGLGKGGWMGLKRICRCHPLSPGGIDEVPTAASSN